MWPKDNLESWKQIHKFIADYPDDEHWATWKSMAREIVSSLENLGLVPLFRVGQSMHHIIFSTKDQHRLTGEPHVTLQLDPTQRMVLVAYSYTNIGFNEPLASETVDVASCLSTILRYLRRLWVETKPDESIPDSLNVV